MIELAEAQAHVLAGVEPLAPIECSVRLARGLVVAETVFAVDAVPPFANTAMDGFAVRAADVVEGARLEVVGTVAAGAVPNRMVGPGEAIRIMTGAPMPDGADAVAPKEICEPTVDGSSVYIRGAVALGDCIRPAGEDLAAGQEIFPEGTILGPGHLGVLANAGRAVVRVIGRPRVGVLSTGDELVEAPTPLGPGKIRDSNRLTLMNLVEEAGFEAIDLGAARDREGAIAAALERGLDSCDAVVTSGGVSVGDFDFMQAVLEKRTRGDVRWMQIAIKPAKPFAFGRAQARDGRLVPVFALPGNPVSSMVSFELLAAPGLRKMAGWPSTTWIRSAVRGVAGEDLRRSRDGKIHFFRGVATYRADGLLEVRSAGGQSSNLLRTMAFSNALAVLLDGETVPAGSPVDILVLGPPRVVPGLSGSNSDDRCC